MVVGVGCAHWLRVFVILNVEWQGLGKSCLNQAHPTPRISGFVFDARESLKHQRPDDADSCLLFSYQCYIQRKLTNLFVEQSKKIPDT
jgi:hypothetical protein